jgi:RNA polymerase sigma-70 factor (ECF subfamily)
MVPPFGAASRELPLAVTQADFGSWVDDHGPALYRVAFRLVGDRHEAEDLVQDAFRSAWLGRESFDAARSPRAWLLAILRRRVVDRWRKRRVAEVPTGDFDSDPGVYDPAPGSDEYSDEMQRALAQLPDPLREALLLVAVGELTHQEAADLLGVPLGTILSRVNRARGRLRELLMTPAKD